MSHTPVAYPPPDARPFDTMIGRLGRLLSEFLLAADGPLDGPDYQTIKHHADDLIGVGNAALKRLQPKAYDPLILPEVGRPGDPGHKAGIRLDLDPAHDPTGLAGNQFTPTFPAPYGQR